MSVNPLPHLETFVSAAELSSFTAAGKALGLTQAAVSQRIAALEADLGAPLFHRQGGRVLLTEAGRRLHDYAQRILALHLEAREQVTGRQEPLVGELSLAASSIPGEHLLPGLLSQFQQRHPNVQVRATVADSLAAMRHVEQGHAHLGLVGRRSDGPHLDCRCFASDRMVLVVPVSHPWNERESVELAELCAQPLILREAGSGSRWCLEQALSRAGKSLSDLRVVMELGSNEAIKEAVQRGLGLAVLSNPRSRRKSSPAVHSALSRLPDCRWSARCSSSGIAGALCPFPPGSSSTCSTTAPQSALNHKQALSMGCFLSCSPFRALPRRRARIGNPARVLGAPGRACQTLPIASIKSTRQWASPDSGPPAGPVGPGIPADDRRPGACRSSPGCRGDRAGG